MKSNKYWLQRFEQLQKAQMGKGIGFGRELSEEYEKAIAAVSKEIAYWYERFADNNGISMAAAKRMLNGRELKELRWDVDTYMKNALNAGEKYAKQLENASAKVHIDRLTALKLEMQITANQLAEKTAVGLKATLEDIYRDGYFKTAYEIQKGTGIGCAFGGLDKAKIENAVLKPWAKDGKNFSQRVWGDQRAKLVNSLETHLTQAVIRGDSPEKLIKQLTDDFKVARSRASTLVMTESAFFASESSRQSMENLGVEKYEIIGTLDSTVCGECGSLDGRVYDMAEYEIGRTAPPFHPNCRCTTAPYIEDEEGMTRIARDKDGKTYDVPADMTYKEWKEWQEELNNTGGSGIINLYRGKGIDIVFDGDISSETIEKVKKATKKISKDFAILENYTEPIRFDEVYDGLAVNNYDPITGLNQITLLKSAFADEKALLKQLEDDYLSGKSYKTDCIESLVAHEIGHNAHITLTLKRSKLEYGKSLNLLEIASFNKYYNKILEDIYDVAFTYESEDEIFSQCAHELGSMAINPKELIAQAFGNYYYGSKKSPIAKKIVKYFKKELK